MQKHVSTCFRHHRHPYTQHLRHLHLHSQHPDTPLPASSSSSQWLSLLRTSISTSNLLLGRLTHAAIITSGQTPDVFLANNLITMYQKCGSLLQARKVFDEMPHRDLISWNSILAAYAHSGGPDDDRILEGIRIFRLFRQSGVPGNQLTLAPVLKLCLLSRCPCSTESVHCYAVQIGLEEDIFVAGALVNIYAKLGQVRNAQLLFDQMPDRDVVLWNVMLKAYMDAGLNSEALLTFSEFHRSGLCPDKTSVRYLLNGITNTDSYHQKIQFDQVRAYSVKSSLFEDDSCSILNMNKTLSGYLQAGKNWSVIDCFMNMIRSCTFYDNVTLVVVLAAVAGVNDVFLGKLIHGIALKMHLDSVLSVGNSLINVYAKTGFPHLAQRVFNNMKEVDLVSWNSIISCCSQNCLGIKALSYFVDFLRVGLKPDAFTLASVVKACSLIQEGSSISKQIQVQAVKVGAISNSFVQTALIDIYSKNEAMEEAERLFQSKPEFDLACFNAILSGYTNCGNPKKALELFSHMHENGNKPDQVTLATAAKACGVVEQGRQLHCCVLKTGFCANIIVCSGILDMYIRCGELNAANNVFAEIDDPDDVAWTSIISGCVENGEEDRALSIYHRMRRSGILPDEFTFATLVKASSSLTALEQGKQIHTNIVKLNCTSDTFVGTSLIDMYAKCGTIEDAQKLFDRMPMKNVALFNAMILGLAQHGNAAEAIRVYESMVSSGVKPDKITFIGVISACSHSGLVSSAREYFQTMTRVYRIKPEVEHYSCLIDAISRSGNVHEAEQLISSMPFEASASMYRALLSACRIKGEVDIGKSAASKLLSLEPNDSSAYVLLSNIYAAANQWDDVKTARKTMRKQQVKKDPGFSWIDIKGKVHLFVVDDKSHPLSDSIYRKVEDLMAEIKKQGYVPDLGFVLLEMEDEEKERSLYFHSEKLAIAFGLLSTARSSPIRVIKNLRVCGDCHNTIKYISKVEGREIVVRDGNRFHHFKNGGCSCGDYW